MQCPRCGGNAILETQKCNICKIQFYILCPECHYDNSLLASYCSNCNHSLKGIQPTIINLKVPKGQENNKLAIGNGQNQPKQQDKKLYPYTQPTQSSSQNMATQGRTAAETEREIAKIIADLDK